MKAFLNLIQRDILLAWRSPAEILNPLLFFIIIVSLFPLAVSPDDKILLTMTPGIIWIAALLATLLSLDNLFKQDFLDGSLDHLLLSPHSLPLLVIAKVSAYWLLNGLPLIIMSPILGLMLHINGRALGVLTLSLSLGTPLLSLIGAIGSALTINLRNSGILLTLLILPLYVPVLIFGSQAVAMAMSGLPVAGILEILAGLLILGITLAPLAISAALRVGVM